MDTQSLPTSDLVRLRNDSLQMKVLQQLSFEVVDVFWGIVSFRSLNCLHNGRPRIHKQKCSYHLMGITRKLNDQNQRNPLKFQPNQKHQLLMKAHHSLLNWYNQVVCKLNMHAYVAILILPHLHEYHKRSSQVKPAVPNHFHF